MSAFTDIKSLRKSFRKLDPTARALALEMLKDDVNSERTAKARAAKGKGGRKKGSKNKEKDSTPPVPAEARAF